ncbi:MAG: cation transporter, partial [Pseudohongiella sp.]|nr:cation transporter [Pseudohongiella sp.]
GLTEILRRFWGLSEVPVYSTMIVISFLALLGNVACLIILRKARNNDPHIRASQIFTSNDVIINAGVLLAGVLVYLTGSKIPDLIIGGIVFVIVVRGAFRILNLAK